MAFASTHKSVATLLAAWNPANAVMFAENQPESPPAAATWIRWSLRPADTFAADVSDMFERTNGLLYFQIFTPEAAGTRVAHDLADKLGAILNQKRVTNAAGGKVCFERVRISYAGKDLASGWLQHNVIVPYSEDVVAVNAT